MQEKQEGRWTDFLSPSSSFTLSSVFDSSEETVSDGIDLSHWLSRVGVTWGKDVHPVDARRKWFRVESVLEPNLGHDHHDLSCLSPLYSPLCIISVSPENTKEIIKLLCHFWSAISSRIVSSPLFSSFSPRRDLTCCMTHNRQDWEANTFLFRIKG